MTQLSRLHAGLHKMHLTQCNRVHAHLPWPPYLSFGLLHDMSHAQNTPKYCETKGYLCNR